MKSLEVASVRELKGGISKFLKPLFTPAYILLYARTPTLESVLARRCEVCAKPQSNTGQRTQRSSGDQVGGGAPKTVVSVALLR